jgi:hypothetical protein
MITYTKKLIKEYINNIDSNICIKTVDLGSNNFNCINLKHRNVKREEDDKLSFSILLIVTIKKGYHHFWVLSGVWVNIEKAGVKNLLFLCLLASQVWVFMI